MANQITLGISAANVMSGKVEDEIEKYLLQVSNEFEIYHLEPRGRHVSAAIDWVLISRIADIAGIASILWSLYENTIRSLRQSPGDNQGLFISIDPQNGLQWFLGNDIDDQEIFIKDFKAKVSRYEHTDEAGRHFQQTVTDVTISDLWVRKA